MNKHHLGKLLFLGISLFGLLGCSAQSSSSIDSSNSIYSEDSSTIESSDNSSSIDARFTVTFNGDGGILVSGVEVQKVNNASEIIEPTYEKSGYTFDGWDKELSSINTDETVIAKWVEKSGVEIEITNFVKDGNILKGFVNPNIDTLSFVDIVKVDPSSTWNMYLDVQGTQEIVTKTASLNTGDNTFYILVCSNSGKTLLYTVVVKKLRNCNVSFNTSGGTTIPTQTIIEGGLVENVNDPEKYGYTFSSWDYDFSIPVTSDIVINAVYYANKYTITYDVNGGDELEQNEQDVYFDANTKLAVPTRKGYEFSGWYSGNRLVKNGRWSIASDTTLIAKWEVINYTITYYLDGGINDTSNPSQYNIESDTITLSNPSKDGLIFVGWFDNDSCTGSPISSIEKGTTGEISLYAKWNLSKDYSNFKLNVVDENKISIYGLYDKTIKELSIPSSITTQDKTYEVASIEKGALANCVNLESLSLPFVGESYTTNRYLGFIFGASSYQQNESTVSPSLKEVIITNGCESIASKAFYGCSNVTSVTLPNSIQTIGDGAFSGCSSLNTLSIPFVGYNREATSRLCTLFGKEKYSGGVLVSQGDNYYGYYLPSSLEHLCITDYIPYYGPNISNCSMIKSLIISASVTSLNFYNFEGCTSLSSIVVPDSVKNIDGIFDELPLDSVEYGNSYYISSVSNPYLALVKAKDKDIQSCEINESTVMICSSAFAGCASLTSINIPSNIASIGGGAFIGCESLETVIIPTTVARVGTQLFSGNSISYFAIPETWTKIGGNMFYNCTSLSYIVIPTSLTTVDNSTFTGCTNLSKVYYMGNKPYSKHISISTGGNDSLTSAKWYYFTSNGASETAKGKWWYYDVDGITIIEKTII